MIKRLLITGKDGQLGRSLQALSSGYPQFECHFVGREELDLASEQSINRFFEENRFDAIINCAAYTAVDSAESNSELADQINHVAVRHLAEIAVRDNALFIHISTDYVFDGSNFRPYAEGDTTNPQNVYGATKLRGEEAFKQIDPRGFIIRTSWVYSEYGRNFVKTMIKLGRERQSLNVIFDQVGTPTYARDLAEAILEALLKREDVCSDGGGRVFHFSNEGCCSWYDFAKAVFDLSEIGCEVLPIETHQYPTPATRPFYTILNKSKIKRELELEIPYWRDSLSQCLKRL